jgi:hypothetical protein
VSIGTWLRRLFASVGPDDEAAAREEFGLPDPGEAELERQRLSSRVAAAEGAEAARDELETLKRPPDPDR